MPTDAIECPLCLGEGKLKRTEVLDRLGVKDFARVAQLSAEEAFRLLLEKHKEDQQHIWLRFEAEIQRVRLGLEDKLRFEQSQRNISIAGSRTISVRSASFGNGTSN